MNKTDYIESMCPSNAVTPVSCIPVRQKFQFMILVIDFGY